MNKLAVVLAVLVFGLLGGWLWLTQKSAEPVVEQGTNANTFVPTLSTPAGIGFRYDEARYGLATAPEQVPATSYIPPCDSGFDYCIYRSDKKYEGTNFESAGLRIKARADLKEKAACLSTPPEGYTALTPTVRDPGESYATSVFAPLGDAAAGHYSSGALYRLSYGTTCYEFEIRVGESQFDNYPAGTIKRFTDSAREQVYAELMDALVTTTILEGEVHIIFPALD